MNNKGRTTAPITISVKLEFIEKIAWEIGDVLIDTNADLSISKLPLIENEDIGFMTHNDTLVISCSNDFAPVIDDALESHEVTRSQTNNGIIFTIPIIDKR